MILQDALLGLRDGYDVLLEGILSVKSYREVFAALLDEHPRENYLFYFAVSVEETVRRHRTRQTANLFSEDDMRQWYRDHDVTGHDCERIIAEDGDAAQTVATIRTAAGI